MINLADVPAHRKKKILAPEAARCPRCGTWAPRNESRRRHYWEANLQQTTILDVIYGCYICPNCPNDDVRWFTVLPYDLDTLRQYTRRTCRLVVEMVRQFKMSIEKGPQSTDARCSTSTCST